MTTKPVYAIAVFNDSIKGTVKFSEDLTNNRVKIDLNITGLLVNTIYLVVLTSSVLLTFSPDLMSFSTDEADNNVTLFISSII